MATFRTEMQFFNSDFLSSISHGYEAPVFDFSRRGSTARFNANQINKAHTQPKSLRNVTSLKATAYLITSTLKANPHLIKYCNSNSIGQFVPRLTALIKERGYNVNIPRLNAKSNFLPNLVTFASAGILEFSPTTHRFLAHSVIPKHHRIVMLDKKQVSEADCKHIKGNAYLYHNRPALTAFSIKDIDALTPYMNLPPNARASYFLLRAYKAKRFTATDIYDETTEILTSHGTRERDVTGTFLDNIHKD